MKKLLVISMALALFLSLIAGCAAPGATSSGAVSSGSPGAGPPPSSRPGAGGTATSAQPGSVAILVTDAPRKDNVITEVWIKVSDVQIHEAGSKASDNDQDNSGWITANISGPNPFELLALKNSGGLQQILAGANLAAGNYTQVRLSVSAVQVKIDGVLKDAEVPSGKLKFVEPFEVKAGQATTLLFDFDADKSVNVTGDGKIMVKPVIKLTAGKPKGPEAGQQGTVKITTSALPNGTDNVSYLSTLTAAGGTVPYNWSLAGGILPAGLGLNGATGVISGTPSGTGTFTFTAKVTDSSSPTMSDTKQLTITIFPQGALVITSASLPDATKNANYSFTVNATGGTAPYSWSLAGGNLPPGLGLNGATGLISGMPGSNGLFTFTIKVTDSSSPANTATQILTLRVNQN